MYDKTIISTDAISENRFFMRLHYTVFYSTFCPFEYIQSVKGSFTFSALNSIPSLTFQFKLPLILLNIKSKECGFLLKV